MRTRRTQPLITLAILALAATTAAAPAQAAPTAPQLAKPADKATIKAWTKPQFSWTIPGATSTLVSTITINKERNALEDPGNGFYGKYSPSFLSYQRNSFFNAGTYTWTVTSQDPIDRSTTVSATRKFTVPLALTISRARLKHTNGTLYLDTLVQSNARSFSARYVAKAGGKTLMNFTETYSQSPSSTPEKLAEGGYITCPVCQTNAGRGKKTAVTLTVTLKGNGKKTVKSYTKTV